MMSDPVFQEVFSKLLTTVVKLLNLSAILGHCSHIVITSKILKQEVPELIYICTVQYLTDCANL